MNPVKSTDKTEEGARMTAAYEQAVQFNYDTEEKKILVRYISMIKGLAGMLNDMQARAQSYLNAYIYAEIQAFTKNQLSDYTASALKKKKNTATNLKNIKEGLLDTETDSKTNAAASAERVSPISVAQLFFARATLDLMFNEKSKGMKGGMMKEKNFKEKDVAELQKFCDESFYYPKMMALADTIRSCSDLSNLWFKEFFLELTKQVQFPTSTSLPWILTEYLMETSQTDELQDLLIPMDLYNDAAFKTLYRLKSQIIYNEIEAEVNLCFDQIMFKMGRNLFRHYKKIAAIKLLDSETKVTLQSTKSFWNQEGIHPNGYENILKQRDFKVVPNLMQLLGRSVNINKILSEMVNLYLRHSIDVAISRFESSDLSFILEMESLLQVNLLTHTMLSKFLQLERFEDLLREVDEGIHSGEFNGRIVTHAVHELVSDVVPNYNFNNSTLRFIRSSVFYAEPIQRPNFPNAKLMYLYGTKVA